jgi:SEC-C motif
MGAIAEGIVAYAQPLLDQTDGSVEQLNKAMTISQLCWNLALLSEEGRDRMLSEIRPSLDMDEEQFGEFRRSIIDPMIRRHREMFPLMHRLGSTTACPSDPSPLAHSRTTAGEAYPGTEPYALCPCKSGRKYKFCCRRKGH